MSKNRTETRKIELVETGNIAIALQRIIASPQGNLLCAKRALYHAMGLVGAFYDEDRKAVREALKLP